MSSKSNSATARLQKDYLRLNKDPVPYIRAEPLPTNILEWHYVVQGPEDTPYFGGFYHGKLVFPQEYPFKPPSIYIITPNGRFKTKRRLCLSHSDFHPETWNPALSVATILTGLLSFMLEKEDGVGSLDTTDEEKRHYAYHSLRYNLKEPLFCELFPETVTKIKEILAKRDKNQNANLEKSVNSRYKSETYSCITNLIGIIGFAAFAFTVTYLMISTASDEK